MNQYITRHARVFIIIVAVCTCFTVSAKDKKFSAEYTAALEKYNAHAYEKALAHINEAISDEKVFAEYFILRSEIYIAMEKYEKAVPDCYKAKELGGNDAKINYLRAKISFVSGNYGIAQMFLNKALNKVSNKTLKQQILVERGKVGLYMQDFQNAIGDLNLALAIDSTQHALLNLAHGYTLMDENEKAKQIYKLVLTDDTSCFKAHMALTELHIKDENFVKALEYAKNACQIDEQSAVVNNYIGYIYYNIGNYPDALTHINKSLKTDPENFNAFKNRALVFFKLNAVSKACDDLFRSMQFGYLETKQYDVLDMYKEECEL
ncbi:MAG: tetratricopeptide repeat protein [Bacteroidetes bacterium]|nr:tetratricopeptide repeat protein [Bacteroidota bacterium]